MSGSTPAASPPPPTPPPPPPPPLDARGLPVGYPFKPDWEVTPKQANELLFGGAADGATGPRATGAGSGKPLLLDCRRQDEWDFAHIQGAQLFPMEATVQRADEIEEAAGGKDQPIIVVCHHGRRSLQVTATLRGLGFTNVKSMAGGTDLWSVTIDPSVKRY